MYLNPKECVIALSLHIVMRTSHHSRPHTQLTTTPSSLALRHTHTYTRAHTQHTHIHIQSCLLLHLSILSNEIPCRDVPSCHTMHALLLVLPCLRHLSCCASNTIPPNIPGYQLIVYRLPPPHSLAPRPAGRVTLTGGCGHTPSLGCSLSKPGVAQGGRGPWARIGFLATPCDLGTHKGCSPHIS